MSRPTLTEVRGAIRGALADGPHERTPAELDHDVEAVLAALAALAPIASDDGLDP